jgi:hypothetical protein
MQDTNVVARRPFPTLDDVLVTLPSEPLALVPPLPRELCEIIVERLQHADLLTASRVDQNWSSAARKRLAYMREPVRVLLKAPYGLSRCNLLWEPFVGLHGRPLGDPSASQQLADALKAGGLAHATILGLSSCQLGDHGISTLATALKTGTPADLEVLSLDSNNISVSGLSVLLSGCAVRGEAQGLASLRQLSLCDNKIGDGGIEALAHACAEGALPLLVELSLSRNHISDAGVQRLSHACVARGAFYGLYGINLSANQIGRCGANTLAQACSAGALPHLERLDVSRNEIDDAGACALVACEGLMHLKMLDLGGNRFGEVGRDAILSACTRRGLSPLKTYASSASSRRIFGFFSPRVGV